MRRVNYFADGISVSITTTEGAISRFVLEAATGHSTGNSRRRDRVAATLQHRTGMADVFGLYGWRTNP